MKQGNVAVNLSIKEGVWKTAQKFVVDNRRKGRSNLSEFTENLWIAYLRTKGVKLPALLKK